MEQSQVDGVELSPREQEYLLPHFTMLLVGKPGSGKTTLLKQLVTNDQMYHKKFDDVFLISPSHAKMGLKIRPDNCKAQFSLDWIFDKIETINREQDDAVFGFKGKSTNNDKHSITGKPTGLGAVLNDNKSRSLLSDMFGGNAGAIPRKPVSGEEQKESAQAAELQLKYARLKDQSQEQQRHTHRNVLFILDDVVGQIKKKEFDPRLAQLVMNRRHIVFNGTVSLIFVTQKYTLIPSRVRSNASWIIMYQLNPNDFETAYNDVVTMPQQKWKDVLHFTFGVDLHSKSRREYNEEKEQKQQFEQLQEELGPDTSTVADVVRDKRFENLGIWVESNIYFKGFKRIKL